MLLEAPFTRDGLQVIGRLTYNRLDHPSGWPLQSEASTVSKLEQVLACGYINCQLAVHLYYELMLQLNLPAYFRSKELWEDQTLFTSLQMYTRNDGGVLCAEAVAAGDIFFFSAPESCDQPHLYHLAVVQKVDPGGNHRLLHAISRKSKTDPVLVTFRLEKIAQWQHRQFVGAKRITQQGRELLAFERNH